MAEPSRLRPQDLISSAFTPGALKYATVREYRSPVAADPVSVVSIDDGGLISYKKPDGSYLHTLNTTEGFHRKLRQLGITYPD
jgi:hypothetical protein